MNGHYLNCWPVKKIVMSDMLSFDSSRIKVIFFYWKIETFLRWLAKPDHWKGNTIWTVCTSVGIVTITPDSCGLRGIRLPETDTNKTGRCFERRRFVWKLPHNAFHQLPDEGPSLKTSKFCLYFSCSWILINPQLSNTIFNDQYTSILSESGPALKGWGVEHPPVISYSRQNIESQSAKLGFG
jgi:hypothetical protein